MKAQVVSDLHLEFGEIFDNIEDIIPVKGDILILPGDIGILGRSDFDSFFQWASRNYKYVLYVPGNHEFYHHEYFQLIKETKEKLSDLDNVHFLYRESIVIENIRFMGCVLWTCPPEKRKKTVQMMYNDYRNIKIKDPSSSRTRTLTIEDTVKFHKDDLDWMESEFELARKKKQECYVICHHVPLLGMKYLQVAERNSEKKNAWYGECTDLSEFILRNMDVLKAFFYGHTHYSVISTFGKSDLANEVKGKDKEEEGEEEEEERIWLISNQVGYLCYEEKSHCLYDKGLLLNLPLSKARKLEHEKVPIMIEGKNREIWGETE